MNARNNKNKNFFPKLVRKADYGYQYTYQYSPTLAEAFKVIFNALLVPLTSLKGLLFKITGRKISLTKVALVALVFVVLYTKDFKFQIGFTTDENANNEAYWDSEQSASDNELARKVSNEYAPVSAKDVRVKRTNEFIIKYKDIAIKEMQRTGIPASIKMGQAIIESRSGDSRLAKENNNHFGIKCFSRRCKKGHCTNHFDDHHKDFFRKFKSPDQSWIEHSKVLAKKRYKGLYSYKKDYKKWAAGLKKAGYATDKKYDKKLIGVIKKYKLYKLDK